MIRLSFNTENQRFEITGEPVGQITNSDKTDFYVYEWFVKETGEVFYVGKGRGDRYKKYHERAYEAEKIRIKYDTDFRFVGTNLTEEEAIELESCEMTRILDETDDILTNRIIPFSSKRFNGYGRSKNTPMFQFEVAPYLYASEIDEHYFGINSRTFDEVNVDNLIAVTFDERNVSRELIDAVYGGDYKKYYDEVIDLLIARNCKIMKSKYAKAVTAWIYSSDDYVTNYYANQKLAIKRKGENVPTYHLIDVWKTLTGLHTDNVLSKLNPGNIITAAKHKRVPLASIENLTDWEKGFDNGFKIWEKGDELRKAGEIEKAIVLFDKARYAGYSAPVLYNSYALAYRKLKDYDNVIEILNEGIDRYKDSPDIVIRWENQIRKAIEVLLKGKHD